MANNRELSQLASFVTVDDTSKTIAFGSTIASLNVTGVGTFGSLTVGGVPVTAATALHPTFLELNVTGVSTVTSFNATGVGTITRLESTNINVSGVGTITRLESTNVNVSGAATVGILSVTGTNKFDTSTGGDVVLINTDTEYMGVTSRVQIGGTTNDASLSIRRNTAGSAGPYLLLGKSRGEPGAATTTLDGDALGTINFYGHDGNGYQRSSTISAIQIEDTSSSTGIIPGRLEFKLVGGFSSTPTTVMNITGFSTQSSGGALNGSVAIGITNAASVYGPSVLAGYGATATTAISVGVGTLGIGRWTGFFATDVEGQHHGFVGVYRHQGVGGVSGTTTTSGYLQLTPGSTNGKATSGGNRLWFDSTGDLRTTGGSGADALNIGSSTGGTVVGDQTSDARLKTIVGSVEYGLEAIKQLDPVRYYFNENPSRIRLGFTAQETVSVIPESVYQTGEEIPGHEGETSKYAMEYVALIPVLVNAVKELAAENESLKARLDAAGL